jgi:coupling of ubiquitin conjugation to ER degradation protein 1
MTEQSINIPQVLVFLVVTFLAIRWYFSKPSAQGTRPTSTRAATPRLNHRQIDDIAQMFPQLSRRDIAWDLQRNGGNAAATTERVLSGRGLDTVSRRHNITSRKESVTNNM